MPQPVIAIDDVTIEFIAGSPRDVGGVWRGVTESSDGGHPSRVALDVPSVGTLSFDFTRAAADFPILPDGTEVRISAAPPPPGCVGPNCWRWEAAGSVRLTLADGSLIAAVALGCDASSPGTMPTIMAPIQGHAGDVDCREPAPIWSTGGWCYVGRTRHSVDLDGVAAPVAPGATARVRIGSSSYDFTNHRYALQDTGGPHIRYSCLPGIPALCAFSAYAIVE